VNAGHLTHYPGGYQYYLDKTKALSARAALTSAGTNGTPRSITNSQATQIKAGASRQDQKRAEAAERQARSRDRKAQQQKVHALEKEIQSLESRQAEIVIELEKQETYEKPGRAQELNRELVSIQNRLGELNPEWETAATKLTDLN
jgi:ATP-binding cassette subfamily F protein 3